MPIYEFVCQSCEHFYEALVKRPGAKAPCPECGGRKVKQAISRPGGFGVRSSDAACPVSGAARPPACEASG